MVFDLPVMEERVKPHQITALHILVALALCICGALFFFMSLLFAYTLYKDVSEPVLRQVKWEGVAIIFAGILLFAIIITKHKWLLQPKINTRFRIVELVIMLALAGYSVANHLTASAVTFGILSATLVFAVLWETKGKNPLAVRIDDEGIKPPAGLKRRFIEWHEIETVLLRYGTLSVNCVDNHLLQWNISNTDVDGEILEAFCNTRIEENKSKRVNDW
jgi:hypothetical protein